VNASDWVRLCGARQAGKIWSTKELDTKLINDTVDLALQEGVFIFLKD